ncbi:preprotein translocase subunit YajC [Thermoanaerobacterium sp. RBIITD]|uniref:preprotein translocase subunit YajC n=1 Tax=Thermoanaerobacterium sp. RBIITD TaxID=1550240 RepID=UPI000BB89891|nr:preprotein translocase subunit YajC [Thermoanaerobacterium sp. RBIITD]SNX52656.1 preprotein translocase subunit YajC [Thermoanaerobacterium sp. RBIITD]
MPNSTIYLIGEIVVMIAIFYFLLILPQQKRDKKERAMIEALKPGDEILTKSGIYGKILNIKDESITIEVGADRVKLKIAKWSVGKVINSAEEKK